MIVQAFLHNTSSALAWGSEAEFVEEVFRFYENSSSQYRLDLAYSGDRDRILASRFLIQVGPQSVTHYMLWTVLLELGFLMYLIVCVEN